MRTLIERATQRLEQLRDAGIAIGPTTGPAASDSPPAASLVEMAAKKAAVERERSSRSSRRVELDPAAMVAAGIITPDQDRSQLADQYRVLKRPLIRNAMSSGAASVVHGNLVMVTSALAGEGKSFTAINLAMSIAAELDHTVMLVDADVARPSIPRMLGFKAGPGLLDVLEGRAELSEVLLRTSVDKLTVLPSGTPHPRATELLASEAMRRLIEEMASRYRDRIIVFDSPPLLLTTESRVLATHMGQILMVIRAGHTPQSAVLRALGAIESHPVRLLVLNQMRGAADHGAGYGYDYRYGYGN